MKELHKRSLIWVNFCIVCLISLIVGCSEQKQYLPEIKEDSVTEKEVTLMGHATGSFFCDGVDIVAIKTGGMWNIKGNGHFTYFDKEQTCIGLTYDMKQTPPLLKSIRAVNVLAEDGANAEYVLKNEFRFLGLFDQIVGRAKSSPMLAINNERVKIELFTFCYLENGNAITADITIAPEVSLMTVTESYAFEAEQAQKEFREKHAVDLVEYDRERLEVMLSLAR